MSAHLESDPRGVIQSCPGCGTANRIAYARLGQQGRCGTCKADLPLVASPVEMTSPAAFAALISQSPLPIVIDFWAAWCGPCQMMAPEFAKAAAQAAGEALFVKVSTDEQQQIAGQFRIQGIPAFALIENGKVTAQTSGFQLARGRDRYSIMPVHKSTLRSRPSYRVYTINEGLLRAEHLWLVDDEVAQAVMDECPLVEAKAHGVMPLTTTDCGRAC